MSDPTPAPLARPSRLRYLLPTPMLCRKCGERFTAGCEQPCRVEAWTAWARGVRCPECASGNVAIVLQPENRERPPAR